MLAIGIIGFVVDPSRITEVLDLPPSDVRRASDGGANPFNGWRYDVHAAPMNGAEDLAQALAALREVLVERTDSFQSVVRRFQPQSMTVYGSLHHRGADRCGVWLAPEDMAMMADCGLGWGLDVFAQA